MLTRNCIFFLTAAGAHLLIATGSAVERSFASQANEITIEVSTDQIVNVSGRGPSLRTVVEDVCYRAGVDVLAYDAEDRPFGGSYSELPVGVFLDRLLRNESFVVRAVTIGNRDHVTALQVLGDPLVASARRARGEGRKSAGFQVPPQLVSTALGTEAIDSSERDSALALLGARIAGDPAQLQGFLSTNPRLIAQAVQRHKGAEAALRELQRRYPDPAIVKKIEDVIVALKALPPL